MCRLTYTNISVPKKNDYFLSEREGDYDVVRKLTEAQIYACLFLFCVCD